MPLAPHPGWTAGVLALGIGTLGYIGHCSHTVLRTDLSPTRFFRQAVLVFSILLVAAVLAATVLSAWFDRYPSPILVQCLAISKAIVYALAYAHAGSVLYWLVLHFFLYREKEKPAAGGKSLSERFLFAWLLLYIIILMLRDVGVQYILSRSMSDPSQLTPAALALLFLVTELIPVSPTSVLVYQVNYAISHLEFYSFTQRIAVPVARRMRRIIPYTTIVFCVELLVVALIYWDAQHFRNACPTVRVFGVSGPQFPLPTFAGVSPFVVYEGPLTWLTALSIVAFVYLPVSMIAFGFTARESALFAMSVGNRDYNATQSTPYSDVSDEPSSHGSVHAEAGGRASPILSGPPSPLSFGS